MGKRIIQQRRGKGSHTYKAGTHRAKGDARYQQVDVEGEVRDIIHDPGRTAPLAVVAFEGQTDVMIAADGLSTGDTVTYGGQILAGNVIALKNIPEGTPIYNIELEPGDGGKIARSSGTFGYVVAHESGGNVTVRLPSKEFKTLNGTCRATIGKVAGGGRTEKPFVKAGTKHFAMRARGKLYPRVSASAMNAVDHPFGGGNLGKHKTTGRNDSPGAKVGNVAARRSGKKKK